MQLELTRVSESTCWEGLQLKPDREHGIIRGVKILGFQSRNKRRYTPEAMRAAASKYEGARVNTNHPKKGDEFRSYHDRIGVVRNVRFVEGKGLFGDLHYNPKHALAEQLAWDAENAPNNCGFSPYHDVRGRYDGQGVAVVESINAVESIDLVADPATNGGLFESAALVAQPSDAGLVDRLTDSQSTPDWIRQLTN